jgi:predicted transcriptional regulator
MADFVRIRRHTTDGLTGDEKSVYYELTELITWEDNFVKSVEGSRMSISEIAVAIDRSRPFVTAMVNNLQEKNLLRIVPIGKGKPSYVYLYSAYVWCGDEKHTSDDALTRFINSLATGTTEK